MRQSGLAHAHAAQVVELPVGGPRAIVQVVLDGWGLLVQSALSTPGPLLSGKRDVLVIIHTMTSNPEVIEVPILPGAGGGVEDLLKVRRDEVTGVVVLWVVGVCLIGPEEIIQEANAVACTGRGRPTSHQIDNTTRPGKSSPRSVHLSFCYHCGLSSAPVQAA